MSDIAQVKDIVPRIQYTASSGQTIFVYPFPVFDAGDIVVEQNGIVLTLATDYTVSGVAAEDGGNITLTSGATAGDIMTIYRDMLLERLIDYQQNGNFLAANVNRDFDRLWLALQQLQGGADAGEGIGRAWRASPDDTLADSELVIAALATRASRFVGFDSNGKFTYTSPSISSDPSQIYSDVLTMQNDASIAVGQFVRTVGYTTPGDGGANNYEIGTGFGTADGGSIIDLPGSGLQAKGLFPGTFISIKQFGAVEGTPTHVAIQAAFDYVKTVKRPLFAPPGQYIIGATLVYDTTGLGIYQGLQLFGSGRDSTIFINSINNAGAGGPTIHLTSGASGSDFMYFANIQDIGFEHSGSGTDSHGLVYRGVWHSNFDDLRFEALNGSAIKCGSVLGDPDSSAHIRIGNLRAVGCIGPGFDTDGSQGAVLHTLEHPYIINCGQSNGNVILDSTISIKILMPSIAGAPGAANYVATQKGVVLKNTFIVPDQTDLWGGEYGNSLQKIIVINACQGLRIGFMRFVKRAGENVMTHGIEMADGTAGFISGVEIFSVNVEFEDALPVTTLFRVGTATDRFVSIFSPRTTAFAGGNVYLEMPSGVDIKGQYIEGQNHRQIIRKASQQASITKASTGSVNVDLSSGSIQRYTITATGAHTIVLPAGAQMGQEFDLIIRNESGGIITVTLNNIVDSTYTDPASGSATSARLVYDVSSANWRQIGAWS